MRIFRGWVEFGLFLHFDFWSFLRLVKIGYEEITVGWKCVCVCVGGALPVLIDCLGRGLLRGIDPFSDFSSSCLDLRFILSYD